MAAQEPAATSARGETPDPAVTDRGDVPAGLSPGGRNLEPLIFATLGLFGLRIGVQPIGDNSMFLHLRTGIDMARTGHIPHSDPYSFTALHHTWVVQSWLAELLYGLTYRIGGIHLVVLGQGATMAVLAVVVAVLARAGSTARTIAASGVAVAAGISLWSPRPLLFGLLGLALMILMVEHRRSPLWLVPIGWVWVNTHGSFPLGLLWLATAYAGAAADDRRRPRWLEPYLGAFAGAVLLGAVNPFGPRLLTFPLVAESKHKVFATIVEWRSPNFQVGAELFALAFIALALLIVLRRGAPWRDVLPLVGFLALGLVSERNLAPAAVVLAPAVGRALRVPVAIGGNGERMKRGPLPTATLAVWAILGLAAAIFVAGAYSGSGLQLRTYPTGAERYLATHGLLDGRRIAAQDYVGDYRELVERSRQSKVFIDDRFDMFPALVTGDYDTLLSGHADAISVLDKYGIGVVMWGRAVGLPDLLHLAGGWRVAYSDKAWEVLVRDPAVPPGRQP